MNVTTEESFKKFIGYCEHWVNYFSLSDIEFFYFHEVMSGEEADDMATCVYGYLDAVANVTLNKNWGNSKVTDAMLKNAAFEEIAHALLGPIDVLARDRTFNESMLESEIHRVIRRLYKIILKDRALKKTATSS